MPLIDDYPVTNFINWTGIFYLQNFDDCQCKVIMSPFLHGSKKRKPMQSYFFWNTWNWKELIQVVGVVITLCTPTIVALLWFFRASQRIKDIPNIKSIVQKQKQSVTELSLKLGSLEKRLDLQEKINKHDQEIQSLRKEITRLRSDTANEKEKILSGP